MFSTFEKKPKILGSNRDTNQDKLISFIYG